ncbi:chaperonin 10-like protein [Chaetomium sp. MPI-SDFR-AT-0129]|nr:chaperonin 10-like protein [Chaetomium sp. MPI-SDFR-AT-0129]
MSASLPKTFKKAAFTEKGGRLSIQEAQLEGPAKGEVLVKVEACGVCHSDSFVKYNAYGVGYPLTPGHEIIGRVAALGEGVDGWKVGDRIGGGWHGGHDGICGSCKKSLFQMCSNKAINGVTRNGGYAEYVNLRAESGVRIPEGIDAAEYAPQLCAGVTVFNSIRQQGVGAGETVAIEGLGGLGHLGVQFANKFGYRTVAISRGADKEKFARELGAHDYIDSTQGPPGAALQKLGGAALIVTTNPHGDKIPELLDGLGPKGKLLILSVHGDIPFNVTKLVAKGLSITSWPSGHATDSEDTIRFVQLENINCMIEKFPLERANEAYDAMMDGKVRFRAVISFE